MSVRRGYARFGNGDPGHVRGALAAGAYRRVLLPCRALPSALDSHRHRRRRRLFHRLVGSPSGPLASGLARSPSGPPKTAVFRRFSPLPTCPWTDQPPVPRSLYLSTVSYFTHLFFALQTRLIHPPPISVVPSPPQSVPRPNPPPCLAW